MVVKHHNNIWMNAKVLKCLLSVLLIEKLDEHLYCLFKLRDPLPKKG